MTPRILIIAGSDSGGGAGIQADIKTVTMLGGHAMTAITAITAQNTLGVAAIHPVPTEMVIAQIDAVASDIGVDAVKIGMIGSAETANAVADRLEGLGVPIVFDPVMVATSGSVLADDATIAAFKRLMKVATLTTPNLPELKALSGLSTVDKGSRIAAARSLVDRFGNPVLVKGGHARGKQISDILVTKGYSPLDPRTDLSLEQTWTDRRIETASTHGTGCTLASAIATSLVSSCSLVEAIGRARTFVRLSLLDSPELGEGHGPMGQQNVRLDLSSSLLGPGTLNQVTLGATDYDTAVLFYWQLGLTQIVAAPPRYARFAAPGGATLSIEVADRATAGSATVYLECEDLDDRVGTLKSRGLIFDQEPVDQDWLWREARLRDPLGNVICLYTAGENRRFPPWRIS